jgi:hypothetical protein
VQQRYSSVAGLTAAGPAQVLFGGVHDVEMGDDLKSTFYSDMWGTGLVLHQ